MSTCSADIAPSFKPKKKKKVLPLTFRNQSLTAAELVDQILNEMELLEGGPGSGRYPSGSGEHPDSENDDSEESPRKPGKRFNLLKQSIEFKNKIAIKKAILAYRKEHEKEK